MTAPGNVPALGEEAMQQIHAIVNAVTSRWVDGLHGSRGHLVDREGMYAEISALLATDELLQDSRREVGRLQLALAGANAEVTLRRDATDGLQAEVGRKNEALKRIARAHADVGHIQRIARAALAPEPEGE